MKKLYTIYEFTNKINGYKYIGITSMSLKDRVYVHVYESRNEDNHSAFKEALRTYGLDTFVVNILADNISMEDAKEKERYYIQKYRTYIGFSDCRGYNSSLGGEGAHIVEDEYLRINQYNLDGQLIRSFRSLREAEAITNVSRISIALVCDNKAITSGGYQWRRFRDSGYKNIGKVKSGIDNVIKEVDQYDLDGNWIKTFKSLQKAADEVGGYSSTIVKVCTGKLRQTRGYQWRYHTDNSIKNIGRYTRDKVAKRKIYQLQGNNVIAEYESISEAAKITGFSMQSISGSINNGILAHGFRWITDTEYKHERSVVQMTLDGVQIAEFRSAMQASKTTDISRASIYNCCIGKNKTAGGYKWRYK